MAATVLDWVSRSLRMLGVLRRGREPTGQLAADAIEAANGLIMSLPQVGASRSLKEVIVSADYTAGEDERVINNGGFTVTCPVTVTDCGQVRTPANGARVVIVTPTGSETNIYLSNSGWQKVSGLTASDPAPLGPEVYTGLCAVLAVHLAPDYDQTPSETVVALAQAGLITIAAQFWRSVDVDAPSEFTRRPDMGNGDNLLEGF